MTSSYWFQGPQGVTPLPGYSIPGSLRFRGAQQLNGPTNTTDSTSYTLSLWFKIGDLEQGGTLFGRQYGSSVSGIEYTNGNLNFREKGEDSSADGVLRDPSAWYHLVYQKDDGNNSNGTAFINGVQQAGTTGFIAPSSSYGWNFGARYDSSAFFEGYLASAYFIDGQVLEPTAFGEYTSDDVWVPIETEFDTADYGANGFYLDFSDPNDIGADRSGNDNHFTPNGFDTVAPANWIAQVYNGLFTTGTPSASDIATALASNNQDNITVSGPNGTGGFDGTTSYSITASPGCAVLRFNTPIENVTRITCEQFSGQGNILNGNDLGNTASSADPTPIYDGDPITFESLIAFQRTNPGNGGWYRISVTANGNTFYLVNNTGANYDAVYDSPTQNFALGNPLMHGIDGGTRIMHYADANLKLSGGQEGGSLPWSHPSIRVPMGVRVYAEFQMLVAGTGMCGVSERRPTGDGDWGSPGTWSWGIDSRTWIRDPSGTNDTTNVPGNWTNNPGKIAGVEVNTTVSPPTVTFTLDGSNPNTFTFNADFDPENIWIGCNSGANDSVMNFGQQPFLNQPEGTIALQTQNLPEAPIKNGREHFRAITGPGIAAGTGGRQGSWVNDLFSAPPGDRAQAHTSTLSIFHPSNGKSNAFDGNLSTVAETYQLAPGGRPGWMSFRPSDTTLPELTASTSFKLQIRRIAQLWVNGVQMTGDFTDTTGSLYDLSSQITFPFTLESLELEATDDAGLFGIELDGELLVQQGILETAQATFPNGLWWIKQRDGATNHELSSSAYSGVIYSNASQAYNTNFNNASTFNGQGVAWCWATDDTGLNKTAGFEIIQREGTATAETINHRLGKEPKMILCYAGRNDLALTMYHASLGPNFRAVMSSTDQFYDEATYWGGDPSQFNSTTFGVGTSPYTNSNEGPLNGGMTYFVWTDIPGYSAFGSYTGNGNADGPFVPLSFRPAFVMFKRTDSTGPFAIFDSTRSPYNPDSEILYANVADAEFAGGSGFSLDLLSNGFKWRSTTTNGNGAGGNYVYCAFAENPFSYPASAR